MIARRHALRARFRHARMRVANSHLGQFVARQARDPEIRQGARDLGELMALYYGTKHISKLHKAFRARHALTGSALFSATVLRERSIMHMSVSFILLIISAICFILSAMGFPTQPAPYNTDRK